MWKPAFGHILTLKALLMPMMIWICAFCACSKALFRLTWPKLCDMKMKLQCCCPSLCATQCIFNPFPTNGNFCHLLITFGNSLDPDQAQQNIGPDPDPKKLFALWRYSWKIFLKKLTLKKNPQRTKKHAKLPSMQRVNGCQMKGWLQWNYDHFTN